MRDQTPRRVAGLGHAWLLLVGALALLALRAQAASPLVLSGAEFQVNTFTTSRRVWSQSWSDDLKTSRQV
jgi:hypothetical protein